MESEQLKLLARSVQPADGVVADAGMAGLRVFVEKQEVIASVASILENAARTVKRGGTGPVSFCLLDRDLPGEVEVATGREFPVTPQVKGAIKSLNGVVTVEEY